MLTPQEMLNKVRKMANLDDNAAIGPSIVKLNKPGRLKLQLLAPDSDNLFIKRVMHSIQVVPESENQNIIMIPCQGINCPICEAANSFRKSGITVEELNNVYKSKYPYRNVRSFLTQPEHFILAARVLEDNADEGYYLPKDSEVGDIQLLQFSKSAINSLMTSYSDLIMDNINDTDDDMANYVPPLFGTFEDIASDNKIKSLSISLRIQVQGSWSYLFTFGNKAAEIDVKDIDESKIKIIKDGFMPPTDDYIKSAVDRIHAIKNYFLNNSYSNNDNLVVNGPSFPTKFSTSDNIKSGDIVTSENIVTSKNTMENKDIMDDFNLDDIIPF